MIIWAIADLHLALGIPEKQMDFFGEPWVDYTNKISENWKKCIHEDDLVLIPGDISWAKETDEAKIDLEWIHSLPGTKVILKGNHDYWWASVSKVQKILPPSIHLIQNNVFNKGPVTIGGTRLWDSPEYQFSQFIDYAPNPRAKILEPEKESEKIEADQKIFIKELGRLELSLKQLNPKAHIRIALTHYPPIGADLSPSQVSAILEKHQIQHCIFGHLHNVRKGIDLFGKARGIHYHLTSCDYLQFQPKKIAVIDS